MPLKKRDYISYSAISTFQSCPLRYYFRYVEQLPEDIVPASLVFGGAIHSCLQFHFERLMIGEEPPDRDTLLDVFQMAWSERADREVVFPKKDTFDSLCRLADKILAAFQGSDFARPRGRIICVEEELRGELIPGLPDLLARVDLIVDTEESLVISDLKTAARTWGEGKIEEASPQLLLYSEMARDLAQGKPVQLQFAVFTKTKEPTFTIHPVAEEEHKVARTKVIIERVWNSIQQGEFYPSPSPIHCPGCPFRRPCAAWKG